MNNGFDHPTWPDPFTEYASRYACLDTYVDADPIARAESAYQAKPRQMAVGQDGGGFGVSIVLGPIVLFGLGFLLGRAMR